jgi:hypothetical protein
VAPINGSAWAGDTSLLSDISEVRAAIACCRSHITASVFNGPAVTLHTKIPPSTSIDPSQTQIRDAATDWFLKAMSWIYGHDAGAVDRGMCSDGREGRPWNLD